MEREKKAIIACTVAGNHFLFLCLRTWFYHLLYWLDYTTLSFCLCRWKRVSYVWIGKSETLAKVLNDCSICMVFVGVSLSMNRWTKWWVCNLCCCVADATGCVMCMSCLLSPLGLACQWPTGLTRLGIRLNEVFCSVFLKVWFLNNANQNYV